MNRRFVRGGGLKTRRRLDSRRTPARGGLEVLLDGGDAGLEILYLVLDRRAIFATLDMYGFGGDGDASPCNSAVPYVLEVILFCES